MYQDSQLLAEDFSWQMQPRSCKNASRALLQAAVQLGISVRASCRTFSGIISRSVEYVNNLHGQFVRWVSRLTHRSPEILPLSTSTYFCPMMICTYIRTSGYLICFLFSSFKKLPKFRIIVCQIALRNRGVRGDVHTELLQLPKV